MLCHTFIATMLDAGVSLRDVQIAARHADPRTTMRYGRQASIASRARSTCLATAGA
jgi:integrase/recombinase XerD